MPFIRHPKIAVALSVAVLFILGDVISGAPVRGAPVSPPSVPRVMGGVGAAGDPRVVALGMNNGSGWGTCSAAMWKPRILLTAGHCTTISGGGNQMLEIQAFAPGVSALTYSNIGPQGASGVPVVGVYRPAGYVNLSGSVQPNDISAIVLGADLAPGAFARLATRAEMTTWLAGKAPITHVGYGLTGPGQRTTLPNSVTLPMVTFGQSNRGTEFGTGQSGTQAICPGDSGSPAYFPSATGDLLLGDIAGGNAPCDVAGSTSNFSNVGMAAIAYLDMLNAAMAQAGYPTIPGAPASIVAHYVSGQVYVGWTPPKISPATVTGYEVMDETGAVLCTTAALMCQIPGALPGAHAYVVRSSNAQGEGDADPTPAAVTVPVAGLAGLSGVANKSDLWVAGLPTSVIEKCWEFASDKPQLQLKRGATWVTIANSTMTKDAGLCPRKKFPFVANYSFTLSANDLGVGAGDNRRVRLRTISGSDVFPTRKTVFMTIDALLNYLLAGGT